MASPVAFAGASYSWTVNRSYPGVAEAPDPVEHRRVVARLEPFSHDSKSAGTPSGPRHCLVRLPWRGPDDERNVERDVGL